MELLVPLRSNLIELDTASVDKLELYIKFLEKWNNVHALTSVSAREIPYVFVVEPLLASRSLSTMVKPKNCVDIGTGFGNPGVAMSTHFDRTDFTLIDSSQKKTALLRNAVSQAKFDRIEVITNRAEEVAKTSGNSFDLVVSRGAGPLQRTLEYASMFAKKDAIVAIFKARIDTQELSEIKNDKLVFDKVITLEVFYPLKKFHRYVCVYRKVA